MMRNTRLWASTRCIMETRPMKTNDFHFLRSMFRLMASHAVSRRRDFVICQGSDKVTGGRTLQLISPDCGS